MMLAAGSTLFGCSQQLSVDKLPSLVQNSFKTQFPAAAAVEWEKKGEQYEAEFELNQLENTVLLDASGKVLMHKADLQVTELPAQVAQALQKDFPSHQIDDLEKVERDGQTLYQVELENTNGEETKVYTAQGTLSSVSYWE